MSAPADASRAPAALRLARDPRAHSVLITLVAAALYAASVDDFYLADDFQRPYLDGLSGARAGGSASLFGLLGDVSMAPDHALFGRQPAVSHAIQIALHAACAVLVAALARGLSLGAGVGLIAGLLFASHPLHAEAVCHLAERPTVLSAFCALGALAAYQREVSRGDRRWGLLCAVLVLGSLVLDDAGALLPAVLATYELCCAPERRWSRVIPSFVALGLYLLVRAAPRNADGAPWSLAEATFAARAGAFGFGLFTPVHRAAVGAWSSPIVFGIGVCSALALGAGLLRAEGRTRGPMLFALALTALAAALPLFGLAPRTLVTHLEGGAALYLASAGACLALAIGLARTDSWVLGTGLGVTLLALFMGLAARHTTPWGQASDLSRSSIGAIERHCEFLEAPGLVIVEGAPATHRGAPLWRSGLEEAVRALHPAHPDTHRVTPVDLREPLPGARLDLRAYAGTARGCVIAWDADERTFVDRSGPLRAATPFPEGARFATPPFERWEVFNAASDDRAGDVWQLTAEGEDLHVVAPAVPRGVAFVEFELSVEGDAPTPALGEVFWAAGDAPFEPDRHHRLFELVVDGELHRYRVAVPLTDPAELGAETLRFRIDPTTFPARVRLRRVELSGR